MKFKEVWQKISRPFVGEPPVNSMGIYEVQAIQQIVRKKTKFDVTCLMDTKKVSYGRKNVGLVMPVDAPAEEVAKAEDVFMFAARTMGLNIDRQHILHYAPDTTSLPGQTLQPSP